MKKTFRCVLFLISFSLLLTLSVFAGTYNYNETESNNTLGTANIISLQNPNSKKAGVQTDIKGYISSTSDIDYFKITPPRHGCFVIYFAFPSGKSYNIELLDANGNPFSGAVSTTYSTYKKISFIATKDQTTKSYYIKVSSNGTYSTTDIYIISMFYSLNYSNLNWTYPLNVNAQNLKIEDTVAYRTYDSSYHTGLDMPSTYGDTVYNMQKGTVKKKIQDSTGALHVDIETIDTDPTGMYTTNKIIVRYYHLSNYDDCPPEYSEVAKGTAIGKVGNTGGVGTHLHLDINTFGSTYGPTLRANPTCLINMVDIFTDSSVYAFTATTGNPYYPSIY